MKALVISDREEIINHVTPLLKEKGFDLIHYRWIIKALDNIEEIQPDVIVLSAMEYPRHWKTLAGFVQSGIGGNDVKLYLYDKEPLSAEDAKKAYDLGIRSFEENFNQNEKTPAAFVNVEVALNESLSRFKFYNAKYYPETNCILFNTAPENVENKFIKYISMYDGNKVSSFSGELKMNDDDNFCIYVKDYYEKEI